MWWSCWLLSASSGESESVGRDVVARPERDEQTDGGLILLPAYGDTVGRAGLLTRWHVYSAAAGLPVSLLVLRETAATQDGEEYRLVGVTAVVSQRGAVTVELGAADAIPVQVQADDRREAGVTGSGAAVDCHSLLWGRY